MRPEAVVHGHEGEAGAAAVQRRQRHVRRVQRVDEVGRERVALLHGARPAAGDTHVLIQTGWLERIVIIIIIMLIAFLST